MLKLKRYTFLLFLPLFSFLSCGLNENEPYNLKYIHIMLNEASTCTVNYKARIVATYSVYLSAPRFTESVEVTYEIVVGNGLKAGLDYNLITTGTKLVFLPGIYDMPIRIEWLPNPIDPSKDNTLKIKLISNNRNYTIGLPGPDHYQTEFTITKVQ